jgi:hypothetical protein
MHPALLRHPFALLVLSFALSACGGGGGGKTQTVEVDFSYLPLTTEGGVIVEDVPTIHGLTNAQPQCTLSSGSIPPGMSLTPNCFIEGTPSAVGDYAAVITLTVPGYSGSVGTTVGIRIIPPHFVYAANPLGDIWLAGNAPIDLEVDYFQMVVRPGYLTDFRLAPGSELPPGLTIDSATGAITGSMGSLDALYHVSFLATLPTADAPLTAVTDVYNFHVTDGEIRSVTYPTGVTGQVGVAFSMAPSIDSVHPLSDYDFHFFEKPGFAQGSCTDPPLSSIGLGVEEATGAIIGTPTQAGTFCGSVRENADMNGVALQPTSEYLYEFTITP